jgi:hypothetical protein
MDLVTEADAGDPARPGGPQGVERPDDGPPPRRCNAAGRADGVEGVAPDEGAQ